MNKLELQKMANEIRKGIITAVHSAMENQILDFYCISGGKK